MFLLKWDDSEPRQFRILVPLLFQMKYDMTVSLGFKRSHHFAQNVPNRRNCHVGAHLLSNEKRPVDQNSGQLSEQAKPCFIMIQNVKKYDYTVQDVYFGLFGYHRSMSSQTLNWVILITHFRVWKDRYEKHYVTTYLSSLMLHQMSSFQLINTVLSSCSVTRPESARGL